MMILCITLIFGFLGAVPGILSSYSSTVSVTVVIGSGAFSSCF
jgi:hypothetical protein